jgi:hypothetical protein
MYLPGYAGRKKKMRLGQLMCQRLNGAWRLAGISRLQESRKRQPAGRARTSICFAMGFQGEAR